MNNPLSRYNHVSIIRLIAIVAGLIVTSIMFAKCETALATESGSGNAGETLTAQRETIVFLSITSDAKQSPQSVDMAMKFAGLSLDEGHKVVMFFQVKGVTSPTKGFPDDFAFQENDPIKSQLKKLIERGVAVHVCPICMKSLNVQAEDLIAGAEVTTRPKLFQNIGTNTVVFTY